MAAHGMLRELGSHLREPASAAAVALLTVVAFGCGDSPAEPGADAALDTSADVMADVAGDTTADTAADTSGDTGDPAFSAALAAYCDGREDAVEGRIDDVLTTLTLAQKVAFMHGDSGLPLDGTWTTGSLEEAGIPGFRMLDGPRGLSRFSGMNGTAFPVGMARGATWDAELEAEVGREIAAELRIAGADTLLAPTVNVLRHPRWGRAQETYGEDPFHLGVMGTGFVLGAQEHTLTVVKHYAVNSIENTRLVVDVQVDERTLRETYLPHFAAIVRDAQPAGVMTAYNSINGDWASESGHLIQDILRDEWHYPGFTVSDWSWGTHDTLNAINAGRDIEMPVPQIYGRPLIAAVEDGTVDVALIDAAVRRILRAQWCFAERITAPDGDTTLAPETLDLAERVAARAAVLLENRDALPIDRDDAPNIVVLGALATAENTGDTGSSGVRSPDVVSMLEGIEAAAGDSTVTHVTALDDTTRDRVRDADVVIAVVGYTSADEGEGQVAAGDRTSLALPDDDVAMLQEAATLSARVITVVVAGSSFVTEGWGDDVEAIVVAWYAGARGGDAIASLLFGDENFTGRLPISFAARDADLPPFDNVSEQVTYGALHGYRHLRHQETPALYPFGFGRSYTTFAHSEVQASVEEDDSGAVLEVSAVIENTGDMQGRDTLQVFVAPPENDALGHGTPSLRGFVQVALEPAGSAKVVMQIPVDDLRIFDVDADAWRLLPGDYTVFVGSDAETFDAELRVPLQP